MTDKRLQSSPMAALKPFPYRPYRRIYSSASASRRAGAAAKRRAGRQHRTAVSISRAVAAREMGNTIMIVRKVGFFGNTQ